MSTLTPCTTQCHAYTRGIVHIVRGRYVFLGGHDLINSHYILQVGGAELSSSGRGEKQFLRLIMGNAPWRDNARSSTPRLDIWWDHLEAHLIHIRVGIGIKDRYITVHFAYKGLGFVLSMKNDKAINNSNRRNNCHCDLKTGPQVLAVTEATH